MVINTACNKQFDFIDISEVCNFNYIQKTASKI